MNIVMDAINQLIAEKFPTDTVYVNLIPRDFKRPSTLIELDTWDPRPAGKSLLDVTAAFALTCYMDVDGHYNTDTQRLIQRQYEVMDLFAKGYMKVTDRNLEVVAAPGGMSFADCFIDLRFNYFDDRPDVAEVPPLMETIEANMTMEE